MSIVQQLTSRNFSLSGGQKKFLNIDRPGPVLCFFSMDSCPGCRTLTPIFNQIAREEPSINYAIINLTSNRDIVAMSRQSTTSISAVPCLLFFVDGNPFAKYNGKKSNVDIKSFIRKILQQMNSSHQQPTPREFVPRGGSYDNNYSTQQMIPQQGHAGYTQQGQHIPPNGGQSKSWMPDIGQPPKTKGHNKRESNYLDDVEDEEEDKLLLPEQIIPYNTPWESRYRKLNNTID